MKSAVVVAVAVADEEEDGEGEGEGEGAGRGAGVVSDDGSSGEAADNSSLVWHKKAA